MASENRNSKNETRGVGEVKTRIYISILFLIGAILWLVPVARAEYAVLRNGQRLHITGYERDGEIVRLHVAGGRVEIRAEDLVAIEPEEFFPALAKPPLDVPFADLIRAAAAKHGLDEELVASVVAAESNFNPRAVSRKQAQGLMQLIPATAARLAVRDVFDPEQNVEAGVRYLSELLERYTQDPSLSSGQALRLALAAYNAGPERVAQYGDVPPFPETRAYVRRVLEDLQERKRQSGNLAVAPLLRPNASRD